MAQYTVLRVRKLKSKGEIVGAFRHDTRDKPPPHADPAKRALNTCDVGTDRAIERYLALLPKKVRKNAVLAVEFIVSASHDTPPSILPDYFENARKWLLLRLGGPENQLHYAIHQDEGFPHSHLIVMPLKDGKLNYFSYLGGTKYQLQELQTDFTREVAGSFNLERGIERSGIKPRNFHSYHAIIASPPPPMPALPPEDLIALLDKGLLYEPLAQELARRHMAAYQPVIEDLVSQANKVPVLEEDKKTVMQVSSDRAKEIDKLQALILENGQELEAYRESLKKSCEKQETVEKKGKKRTERDDDGWGY